MSTNKIYRSLLLVGLAAAVAALGMTAGCATATKAQPAASADPPAVAPSPAPAAPAAPAAVAPPPSVAAAAPPAKSGSQMWAEVCGQCHNIRDPGSYSAAQWEVAVHHMRLRVPLTGEQQTEITKFLTAK
jgi:cytochrome c5